MRDRPNPVDALYEGRPVIVIHQTLPSTDRALCQDRDVRFPGKDEYPGIARVACTACYSRVLRNERWL